MSETQIPEALRVNPITGDAPGIREILERRSEGVPDTPPPVADPTDRPAKPAPPADAAEQAAAELARWKNRASEADRRAEEEARARQAAEQHAARVAQGAEDTGFTAIVTALGAAQGEVQSLKSEMKTAGEAGDFGRIAEITERLGRLGFEVGELERGKLQYEQQRGTRLQPPPQQRPSQPQAGTATERAILGELRAPSRDAFLASRTDATAAFLRENPQFFTDEAAFRRMTGAEALARGRGLAVDTQEYFNLIKQEAGVAQPEASPTYRPPETPATPSPRNAPPTAAAPSREAPQPGGKVRPGDVYVSAEDKTAAEWMGVDPADYAAEKQRLSARGEWPYRRR
jgi:hypothetical protein